MTARKGSHTGVPSGEIADSSVRAVIASSIDGIVVVDGDGVVRFANPAASELLGRKDAELVGSQFGFPVLDGESAVLEIVSGGETRLVEMRIVGLEWHGTPAWLATLRDVTVHKPGEAVSERRAAEQAAIVALGEIAMSGQRHEDVMAEAARQVRVALSVDVCAVFELLSDVDELSLVASDGLTATAARLAGAGTQARHTVTVGGPVVVEDARAEAGFAPWPPPPDAGFGGSVTVAIKDRERVIGVLHAASRSPRRFDPDEVRFAQAVANLLASAIARSRAEHQMRQQALHDPLTGLANRILFHDRLEHALARAKRQKTGLAVLFADLDGFKRINDSLGHQAGDELLIGVAARLVEALRTTDSVARFGGDEFMMILEDIDGEPGVLRIVSRIHDALARVPLTVQGKPTPSA